MTQERLERAFARPLAGEQLIAECLKELKEIHQWLERFEGKTNSPTRVIKADEFREWMRQHPIKLSGSPDISQTVPTAQAKSQ